MKKICTYIFILSILSFGAICAIPSSTPSIRALKKLVFHTQNDATNSATREAARVIDELLNDFATELENADQQTKQRFTLLAIDIEDVLTQTPKLFKYHVLLIKKKLIAFSTELSTAFPQRDISLHNIFGKLQKPLFHYFLDEKRFATGGLKNFINYWHQRSPNTVRAALFVPSALAAAITIYFAPHVFNENDPSPPAPRPQPRPEPRPKPKPQKLSAAQRAKRMLKTLEEKNSFNVSQTLKEINAIQEKLKKNGAHHALQAQLLTESEVLITLGTSEQFLSGLEKLTICNFQELFDELDEKIRLIEDAQNKTTVLKKFCNYQLSRLTTKKELFLLEQKKKSQSSLDEDCPVEEIEIGD